MEKIEQMLSQLTKQFMDFQNQLSDLQKDVSEIKQAVNRIEESQNDDVIAMLRTLESKISSVEKWREQTDKVVDLLAVRTTRIEANIPH